MVYRTCLGYSMMTSIGKQIGALNGQAQMNSILTGGLAWLFIHTIYMVHYTKLANPTFL